ncbi:hypothetical protein PVK06_002489 [Gossypium arboreum]|uniref:DUF4219 domain-containing protein n=1 Tax=Gossypium arboreum TaxID=29729 RepID=A0ABR0R4S5_GOSAR|nr:hypothetical protein PVK06_002489 [Gossypium arboreum]
MIRQQRRRGCNFGKGSVALCRSLALPYFGSLTSLGFGVDPHQRQMLFFDESARGKPGPGGCGGVLRNSSGDILALGTHYHVWAVKMIVYLRSLGLWKVVETDEDPPALRQNPTIAQLKAYDEEILKKDKALTCIHSGLVDHIFTSIMDLETPKAIWN